MAIEKLNAALSLRGKKIDIRTLRERKHGASWLKPAAKSGKLFYVSDPLNGYVYVYAWLVPGFARGTMMGQLGSSVSGSGPLFAPVGECVDKNANVYVADAAAQGVWEFAHNQIIPINFLADPGNVPWSCSVDKGTGNVAVTNFETTTGGSGSVYVYPGGASDWVPYYNIGSPPMNFMWFDGYDPNGNLWADGSVTNAPFDSQIVELPKGADEFIGPIGLQGVFLTKMRLPGQIQWDAGNLDVGDRQTAPGNAPAACVGEPASGCGALYGTRIKSSGLKQEFVTNFVDTLTTFETWTVGTRVIVPNPTGILCAAPKAPAVTCTQIYYYGLGVQPINEVDDPYYQLEPWGVTLSP